MRGEVIEPDEAVGLAAAHRLIETPHRGLRHRGRADEPQGDAGHQLDLTDILAAASPAVIEHCAHNPLVRTAIPLG